jgi:hypothetical protein
MSNLPTPVSVTDRQLFLLQIKRIYNELRRCMRLPYGLPVSSLYSGERACLIYRSRCKPISRVWNLNVRARCINGRASLISIATLNSLGNFLVYL